MALAVRLALIALALALTSCTKHQVAEHYFSAAMAGRHLYALPGVSGFELRSYEIVQSTNELVAVRLTFAGKRGNDIVQTKKFTIVDGRLKATDRSDIRDAIKANLSLISMGVFSLVAEDMQSGKQSLPLTYERLVASKNFLELPSVEGEEYKKISINKLGGNSFEISLPDSRGQPVVYVEK